MVDTISHGSSQESSLHGHVIVPNMGQDPFLLAVAFYDNNEAL